MFGYGDDDNQRDGYQGDHGRGNASEYAGEEDLNGAARHAQQEAGDSGDPGIFSSVLSMLGQNKQGIENEDLDEEHAVRSHQQLYGEGGSDKAADTNSMGAAAAMEALKKFGGGAGSGGGQNAFVGMAMAQASKLFDQQSSQGNVASGSSKQSVVQQAGSTALKMYLKSQGGGSGLMGMASKFL